MNRIKDIVNRLLVNNYFNRDTATAEELKIKINSIKRLSRQLSRKNYHNNPDATILIINYYFQIKVNNLILSYFNFKIEYKDLIEELVYLNDCLNEIEKGLKNEKI